MGIKVLPAEDADLVASFTVCSRAFASNEPIWDTLYPAHFTGEGRTKGGQRLQEGRKSDPHINYYKAVDDSTGEIVGFAKWLVYDNSLPEPSDLGKHWDSLEEEEYANHIVGELVRDRQAYISRTNGNLVSLDCLAIDPAHQRRGIGGKLVAWGTQKADELGVDAVVESSVPGRGLYERHGFVYQKDVVLPVPDKWAGRPKCKIAWLVRPKRIGPAA